MKPPKLNRLLARSALLLLLSVPLLLRPDLSSVAGQAGGAKISIQTDHPLGRVSPYLYSSVVRWDLGKGLSLPESATPEDFFRLAQWVKSLNLTMLRYPGGTVADAFFWKESIGPLEKRPQGTITGFDKDRHDRITVGLDEFLHFCQLAEVEPLIVVNFGNGSPEEAAELVEYLNAPDDGSNPGGGMDWAKQRAGNGHPQPYGVKYFEIGNEIYLLQEQRRSFKQFGHTDINDYATRLVLFAKRMREIDASIKIGCPVISPGAVGASDRAARTRRPWNKTLFEIAGKEIDFVCPHIYGPGERGKEYQPSVEVFVKKSFAYLEARRRELKELQEEMRQTSGREFEIFVTEYNMTPNTQDLLSGVYIAQFLSTCIEGGVQGAMFHNLFGFGDNFPALKFVKTQNLRVPRPTYFALKLLSNHLRGERVATEVYSPSFTSEYYPELEVPYLSAIAVKRGETLVLEVINKDISGDYRTEIEIPGHRFPPEIKVFELNARELKANNEADLEPLRTTVRLAEKSVEGGGERLTYTFLAHSVTILEF
jgi:alpha-L-arabinofuranosidase